MSLLVRRDMQSSVDPFAAHHLVIKRASQIDDGMTMSKRSKPDEETISSDVASTSEQADKAEKRNSSSQPEVCICLPL